MEKDKKRPTWFVIMLTIIVACTTSCSLNTQSEMEVGDVTIRWEDSLGVGSNASRALLPSDIIAVRVSIAGSNISPTITQDFQMAPGNATVVMHDIPVGINHAIQVEALDGNGDPVPGLVLYCLADIVPGMNSITVHWDSTPLGSVYWLLLQHDKTHATQYASLDPEPIEAKVQQIITDNALDHPSFVDADRLAMDLMQANGVIPQSNAYVITPSTVSVAVHGLGTGVPDSRIRILDPASSEQVLSGDGTYTFSVLPGRWLVELVLMGGLYQHAYTVDVSTPGMSATELVDASGASIALPGPLDFSGNLTLDSSYALLLQNYQESYGFEDSLDTMVGTSSGNQAWLVTQSNAYAGISSFCNGDIGNSQSSSFTLSDTVPAGYKLKHIQFYYATSTEGGWDYFRFYVDGTSKINTSGNHSWNLYEETLDIPAGQHYELHWTYQKDGSVSHGADTVWIDEVVLTFERMP